MVSHLSAFLSVSSKPLLVRKSKDTECKEMCAVKCNFKFAPSEKALGDCVQGNGFSPEYVLKCIFKFPPSEKAL